MIPHITQIEVLEQQSNSKFNIYVLPKVPATESASCTTRIKVPDSGNVTVKAEKIQTAVDKFLAWLEAFFFWSYVYRHNGGRFPHSTFNFGKSECSDTVVQLCNMAYLQLCLV